MKRNAENRKRGMSSAMTFILLFGIVSLFSDMTHEGASSIRGAYLSLLGAGAGTIGFVSGLGELIGYSMRYVFGRITDRTGLYWPMTVAGYVIDIAAVPALALTGENGWVMACVLLAVQRMGKAIKKPAKDALMSFAASREGVGKSFAVQEVLDQVGAFLGPVLLYLVMLFRTEGSEREIYSSCFAFLAFPGALTLILLAVTKHAFPSPEEFEQEEKEYRPFRMKHSFVLYMAATSLFAFGFMDYSLISMHVENTLLVEPARLPLLYASAMLIDAFSALFFGLLYDRIGIKALVWATLLSSPFAVFVFLSRSPVLLECGVLMWGIGMGAQESVLKAAVTTMVPKSERSTGFAVYECSFGVFWFLGSWLLGSLYSVSIPLMAALSVISQLLSVPFYILSSEKKEELSA